MDMGLTAVNWPAEMGTSKLFSVSADGVGAPVLVAERSDVAMWNGQGGGTIAFDVEAGFELAGLVAHPLGKTTVRVDGKRARVELQATGGMGRVVLECSEKRLLTLLVEGERVAAPAGARVFQAGKLHEVGLLEVKAGETVWIEPGAVVRGGLRIKGAGVTVGGGGVLDAGGLRATGQGRSVIADGCRRLTLGAGGGLIVINPPTWQVVLGACEDVEVRDLKLLGKGLGTDGVDIVGCKRVRVSDCLIICGDDCFVVKAFGSTEGRNAELGDWARDVEDVTFERSIVGNFLGGSALEIGHELPVGHVRNVVFRDIDVMFVHNHGSVYGIHHADSATIENVRFEKIRVAHCYDKLVDIRVIKSMWSKGEARGRIRGVVLEDCDWTTSIYNAGYTTSQIGGFDAEHLVEDVVFRNFRVDGKAIESLDEIELFTRNVNGVRVG